MSDGKPEQPRPAGLGDTVARAAQKIGIKPCGGCQKRREQLNKLFPYRRPEGSPR